MEFQSTIDIHHDTNGVIINEPQLETISRSRTLSTLKGRKLLASDRIDENSFLLNPPKTPLRIARTVRRTLSGGLSNILRPFQPKVRAWSTALSFHFIDIL